jgi:natural product biosynthesis luciferase-like monooxygenase protein
MKNDVQTRDEIAERVARLSPAKRALLEQRLRAQRPAGDGAIPRRGPSERAPLSFAQQRLWFLHQMDPEGRLYNIPQAFRIVGDLDVDALRRALNAVVARHEALRTTFWAEGEAPAQVVAAGRPVDLRALDLRGRPDPGAEARRLLSEEARRPFDLSADLMLRALLLRTGQKDHLLLLTLHHIAADGWSLGVLFEEVSALYRAFCAGGEASLPDPPVQYADFSEWQRRRLKGALLDGQLSYWRQHLGGDLPALDLPVDRPRPPVQTFRGATHGFALPRPLGGALRDLAGQERATLFMALLTGFEALLSRYAGQDDIVVGTPIANRNRAEVEGVIGCFVNVLAPRTDLSGDPTFRDLLRRVRGVTLGAYGHQDLPFERLVEELQPERDLSRNPLFQVMFALQTPRGLELPGLAVSPVEVHTGTSKFDLTLTVEERPEGLAGSFEYSTDLFDAATMERMAGHFRTLLEGAVADPDAPLSRLPLLTEAERRLLVSWNDTAADCPHRCIHQLFEDRAAKAPGAVAVAAEELQLTYGELNARANRLARHLQRLGVGPDVRVGLCTERSLDMVVGLLGILKAGGAYVPLDPAYPEDRLAFMLGDAGVAALLTQGHLAGRLSACGARTLCLDTGWAGVAREPDDNPEAGVAPENLAYVIYTSGSTGRPKGVMVEHRNVVNFFIAMDRHLRPEAGPGVWLAVTSLSFDISALELLWTLARGFKVVLYAGHDRARAQRVGRAERDVESGTQEIRKKRSEGPEFLSSRLKSRLVDFSLFYFASDAGEAGGDRYRLLLEGAKFADRHGFAAVWTPERHFHAFGGLYPNPSVAGAALAALTQRVQIRAGSVVLPLHHPIRVAEEWALVDNLSGGRVGVSFASGWQSNDFVLNPGVYADRKALMFREIETVRRLWRGERVAFAGPNGKEVEVQTLPRPIQPELPVWVTAAGSPDTFRMAGEIGANLLTHLLGQGVEDLAEKIAVYRRAREGHGHGRGHVTLMVHTFVGEDEEEVRETVRKPMTDYLRSAVDLIKQAAASSPQLNLRSQQTGKSPAELLESRELSEEDMQALLNHAFERYFKTSGLFGTPEACLEMVRRLRAADVDEIACLIDFGVEAGAALAHLEHLNALRELASAEAAPAGASIPALIAGHGVTHLQCTPSMGRMLVADEETRRALGSLRALLVGGEAFPAELARELRGAVSGDIFNVYGPTETTIWSALHRLDGPEDPVPIGRPLANTELYVLDRHLQPVPVGQAGELFIGGRGVVRGYLNRPKLTAERFLPDPFSGARGARLYRTGDLARFRPDGEVEFLGRMDHQVKVRGYRVELGEIESLLDQHPAVRTSVVVAREDTPGDQRLVAYLIPRGGRTPQEEGLRDYLRQKLPEYMMPSAFVPLDAFPLTPNGKVDRKALPAPDRAAPAPTRVSVEPRDDLERQLLRIWEEVLDRRPVGVWDNFFDLGGHSLLAVRLFAQIEQALGRKLPLATLFQAPTVAQLAGVLREKGWSAPWSALVPIQPHGSRPPFYFVHAHGGNVLGYYDLARHLGADQPFYGLQAQGLSGGDVHRFEEMAVSYVREVRLLQPHGPYFLGGWCMGGNIALEMAQQLQRQGEEVGLVVLVQSAHPDYPRYRPGVTGLHRLLYRLVERVDLEVSNFLEAQDKPAYAWRRMGRMLTLGQVAAEKALERLLGPLGLRLPRSRAYTLEALAAAHQKTYMESRPHPYRGRVLLFRAAKQPLGICPDPTLGWDGLIEGELDVREVPGHAIGILSEPRVGILAGQVRGCLDRARRAGRPARHF